MSNKKQVIETLCQLITVGDDVERCYAIRALGNIGSHEAISLLLDAFAHTSNSEIKMAIVDTLSNLGAEEIISSLLEIAENPLDWEYDGDWDDWWLMQLKAIHALGRMRVASAVPVLVRVLEDEENQEIESKVLKTLALLGGDGETVLIQRLTGNSAIERRNAAIALGFSKSAEARKALVRAMIDKVTEVRISAIQALGKMGASQYLELMLRFLNDNQPEMRRAVIEVITSFSTKLTENVQEKITSLLIDSDSGVRAAVLNALRKAENIPDEILTQVRICLRDTDNLVVAASAMLLASLGDNTILQKLLRILSNQEVDVILRSKVATALGILGNTEAIGILSWSIKDKAHEVRSAAINSLIAIEKYQVAGIPTAKTTVLPTLFIALTDEDSSVRTETIQYLTALIPKNLEQRQRIDKHMPEVRIDVIITQFVRLLEDTDINVRKAAAEALGKLGEIEAEDKIIKAGFANDGVSAQDMGQALYFLNSEKTASNLLNLLETIDESSKKCAVIKMLEELFKL
jgi:HEAT repeat protein